jgi:hypothetical protein
LKKFAVLCAAAACVGTLGVAGIASAGPEVDDAAGNFLVLDADFTPPASSTKKTVSAVNLEFHASFGNKKTGAPFPASPNVALTTPKGTVFNGESFPTCTQPTKDDIAMESRCGREQLIGAGEAVIDARGLGVPQPLKATLTAYNQAKFQGAPTIAIFATTELSGTPITAEVDMLYKGGKLTLYRIPGAGSINYSFDSFDLTLGGIEKISKREKISLWEAPRKCPKAGWKWAFNATAQGVNLTAKDTQGCVQFKD